MKTFRAVLWVAIFGLGAFLAYSTITFTVNKNAGQPVAGTADVGGPFEAVFTDGSTATQQSMLGKPHAIFFGFTHCPDICPTTLYEATSYLQQLGPDGDKLDVYFITVDPKRDTKELLGQYLTGFDPRIKGITGSEEQIKELAQKWRVFYQYVGEGEDYTVSHTSNTFLMNSKGEFVRTIAYGENKDVALQKIRKLIKEDG